MVGIDEAPAFLDVSSTLRLFRNGDAHMLRQRFERLATTTPVDHAAADRIRSSDRILGNGDFKDRVLASS